MGKREPELFKDKVEISLDGHQIFYVFFGGALIACMVFVLGVLVGRRVEARGAPDSGYIASANDPLAALDRLERSEQSLAFPAALRGDTSTSLGAVDQALTATKPVGEGAEAGQPEPATETQEDIKEPAPTSPAKAEEPRSEREPDAKTKESESEAKKTESAAPASVVTKPDPDTKKTEKKEPVEANQASSDAASSTYTLQVGSFRSRPEADELHQRLRAQGYDPYVAKIDLGVDKGVWFRVRLGGYSNYEAALQKKGEFESKVHIIAYVTRLRSKESGKEL